MIIYADRLTHNRYQLFCSSCNFPLDIVDSECLRWHIGYSQPPLCFECAGIQADLTPQIFDQNRPFEILIDNLSVPVL